MVFNTTFNNISGISWRSVLLVEETRVPGENHQPVVSHCQTLSHNAVSSEFYFSYLVYKYTSTCPLLYLYYMSITYWMFKVVHQNLVPYIASYSGLSILDCSFSFLKCLFAF